MEYKYVKCTSCDKYEKRAPWVKAPRCFSCKEKLKREYALKRKHSLKKRSAVESNEKTYPPNVPPNEYHKGE